MITEDYVSFEIAKLLNEKGFDEPCRTYYQDEKFVDDVCTQYYQWNSKSPFVHISAPTHQMAIKWLREVLNIFIHINRDNQYYEGTPVMPITEHDKKRGHSSEYYAVVLDAKSNSKSFEHFDRYEEAVEAALKYSLENLI